MKVNRVSTGISIKNRSRPSFLDYSLFLMHTILLARVIEEFPRSVRLAENDDISNFQVIFNFHFSEGRAKSKTILFETLWILDIPCQSIRNISRTNKIRYLLPLKGILSMLKDSKSRSIDKFM